MNVSTWRVGWKTEGEEGEMESSNVSDSGILVHDHEIFSPHARRCEEQLEPVEFRLGWSRSRCRGVRLRGQLVTGFRSQASPVKGAVLKSAH